MESVNLGTVGVRSKCHTWAWLGPLQPPCSRRLGPQREKVCSLLWLAHPFPPESSVSLDGGSLLLLAAIKMGVLSEVLCGGTEVLFLRVREALCGSGPGTMRCAGGLDSPLGLGCICCWRITHWQSLPALSLLRLPWSVLTFAILVESGRWASSGVKGSVKSSTGKVSSDPTAAISLLLVLLGTYPNKAGNG